MNRRDLLEILGAIALVLLLMVLGSVSCIGCAARQAPGAPPPAAAPASASASEPASPAPFIEAPAPGSAAASASVAQPAAPPATVPDPGVTEQHYRLRLQLGPTVAGILPAYVSPVECRVPLAELRSRHALALAAQHAAAIAARDAADDAACERLRWLFGCPLLAIGLVLLALGAYLTVKGADLGTDLAILGAIAAALGLVLFLYPRQAGWAGASVLGAITLYAFWRAWGRARARQAATAAHAAAADIVGCVDAVRADLGETLWKQRVAPVLREQLPDTRALVERIQAAAADTAPELER
jgi:hypothetical protein